MLSKIFDTQQNRRSAVSEVSSWLAQPTRDDGDMPLPPKRGSRSQPVVDQPTRDNGDMRRYRRRAVPEVSTGLACLPETMATCRYRLSAVPEVSTGLAIPPETMATCRYRRSAVPEVSTGLACLPRDNGDMRRYRRRAVVEGACRQVTCCSPNFPYNKTESNEMETPQVCANLRCLSGDGEIRTLVQTWN